MLTCTKCKKTKDYELFPLNKHTKSGRGSWCRECKKNERIARMARTRELKSLYIQPINYEDYLHNENRKWLIKLKQNL